MKRNICLFVVLTFLLSCGSKKNDITPLDCHRLLTSPNTFENKILKYFLESTKSFCSSEPKYIDEPVGYLDALYFSCDCDTSFNITLRLKENANNKKRFSAVRKWKVQDFESDIVGSVKIDKIK